MAVKRYVNSAWTDISALNRYVNGAYQSCECAKKYSNGAWVDVWTAKKYLNLSSDTITNGVCMIATDKSELYWTASEWREYSFGSLTCSGSLVFTITGSWSKPTVSFDYSGNMIYSTSNTTTNANFKCYTKTAGTVKVTCDSTTLGTATLGTSSSTTGGTDPGLSSGSFSKTSTASSVSTITITVTPTSYTSSYYYGSNTMIIENFTIDGELYYFPTSADFERQQDDY